MTICLYTLWKGIREVQTYPDLCYFCQGKLSLEPIPDLELKIKLKNVKRLNMSEQLKSHLNSSTESTLLV